MNKREIIANFHFLRGTFQYRGNDRVFRRQELLEGIFRRRMWSCYIQIVICMVRRG